MKRILVIKADTNDADYITSEHNVSNWPTEAFVSLTKIANAIKDCSNHFNWPYGEYDGNPRAIYGGILTDDEIDFFNDLVPYGEWGIHTIKSIRILTISEEINLI